MTCKEVSIYAERWGVHVAGTPWMFNYAHSMTSTVIHCVNMLDGSVIGEMPVAGTAHSSTTINGQIYKPNEIILATLYEKSDDDKR